MYTLTDMPTCDDEIPEDFVSNPEGGRIWANSRRPTGIPEDLACEVSPNTKSKLVKTIRPKLLTRYLHNFKFQPFIFELVSFMG